MKIILEGYNKSIHKKGELLQIKEKTEEIYTISPKKVSDITLFARGYITFDALNLIAKHNIPVISINYFKQVDYIILNPNKDDIKLRKLQYHVSENIEGIEIAKEIILSKMRNQYSTLKTLNKNRKNSSIKEKQQIIKQNIKKLEKREFDNSEDIYNLKNKLMGLEGETSHEYWSAISIILPENINFKNREQIPKKDVTNAMLNYGYAILASEITKDIILEKIDPYCGILHADQNNRLSLTYDLIEQFRQQIVDKTVFSLINKKMVTENDINKRTNLLNIETKKILANKIMEKIQTEITYEDKKMTYDEIIELQVKKFKYTIRDNTKYQGFYLQW